jgi:hypothetical protein
MIGASRTTAEREKGRWEGQGGEKRRTVPLDRLSITENTFCPFHFDTFGAIFIHWLLYNTVCRKLKELHVRSTSAAITSQPKVHKEGLGYLSVCVYDWTVNQRLLVHSALDARQPTPPTAHRILNCRWKQIIKYILLRNSITEELMLNEYIYLNL